jgi:hypothetical protein
MYSSQSIDSMNYSTTWNCCISKPEKSISDSYVLYPTGEADLNGRKYVALPKECTITSVIKQKYNLML